MKQSLSFRRLHLARLQAYFSAWLSSPHGVRRNGDHLWQNAKARSAKVHWTIKLLLFVSAASLIGWLVGQYPVASGMILCLLLGITIGILCTFFITKD